MNLLGIPVVEVDWMLPDAFALNHPNGDVTYYSHGRLRTYTKAEQQEIFDAVYNQFFEVKP